MYFLLYVLIAAAAYMLGNISTGLIVGKSMAHIDIRDHGSGNAGTTNIMRTLGYLPSAITLIGDVLKAMLSVWMGHWIGSFAGVALEGSYVAAVAVVVGHNWPVVFRFKGGKGIASSLGVMLALTPAVGLIVLALHLIVLVLTRYMSVASMAACVFYPVLVLLMPNMPSGYLYLALILSAMGLFSHRANMQRLIKHTENRLDFGKIQKYTNYIKK